MKHKKFTRGLRMALFMSTLSLSGSAAALEIARNGQSNYVIVVGENAIPAEKTAATELQKYVHLISGAELPIVHTPQSHGNNILLGCTPEFLAMAADPALDAEYLEKSDAIVLTTNNGNLFLCGNRPRGTLYAVYTLLEEYWNVRFWSASEEFVPKMDVLTLPENLTYRYAPKFFYRETYFTDANTNAHFAAKIKSNGDYQAIPDEWGGKVKFQNGFCHTATFLVTPAEYFKDHPEYFALDEHNKRSPEQLCWTHPGVHQALIRSIRKIMEEHPGTRIIAVDHMDSWLRCQCETCKKVEADGGSAAAPVVMAVNAVAAELSKDYPDLLIETLAYLFAQKPPMQMQVHDNVLIRLCPFLNDFSRSYDDDVNAKFRDDLKNWPKIADKLMIWDYLGNFTNFMVPHPNIRFLGDNIKLYAANNIQAVFSQGDVGTGNCGDYLLKGYIVRHMLWNPELNQREIMKDFLNGYYSPAVGEMMLPIIDQVCDDFLATGKFLGCYRFDVNDWLTFERIQEILGKFDQMEKLLENEEESLRPIYRERLRRARLPYEVSMLISAEYCGWNPDLTEEQYQKNMNLWKEIRSIYSANNVTNFNEVDPIRLMDEKMPRRLAGPRLMNYSGNVPEFCQGLPEKGFLEFSADVYFEQARPDSRTFLVDDPSSPYGRALKTQDNHADRAFDLWLPDFSAAKDQSAIPAYDVYVSVRATGNVDPEQEIGRISLHDWRTGQERNHALYLKDLADGYRWYTFDNVKLSDQMIVFLRPAKADANTEFFVDRVIMVPRKDGENHN